MRVSHQMKRLRAYHRLGSISRNRLNLENKLRIADLLQIENLEELQLKLRVFF